MMRPTSVHELGTRRLAVSFDRVVCWRVGPGVLDRCRECVYLLRLECATAPDPAAVYVVCADDVPEHEVDFAW